MGSPPPGPHLGPRVIHHQEERIHGKLDSVTIIQLISGAVGGNIPGSLFKNLSLGSVGNSIAGALGGLGGQLLSMAGLATGGGWTSRASSAASPAAVSAAAY